MTAAGGGAAASRAADREARTRRAVQVLLLALAACWVLLAVADRGRLGQDAAAFVSGGRLATHAPASVYGDHGAMDARFRAEVCTTVAKGQDCAAAVPFVSLPQLLPLLAPLRWVPGTTGVLLVRLLAAAGFVGAGIRSWQLRRGRRFEAALALAGVLATPFVAQVLLTGQWAGVMLLSALVAPEVRGRVTSWVGWCAHLTTGLFKLFPFGLYLLVRRRAWWLAAAAVGVFTTVGVVLLDSRLFRWFLQSLDASSNIGTSTNLSLDALVSMHVSSWSTSSVGYWALLLARLAVLVLVDRRWVARADPGLRWAWRWTALVFLVPVLWWFYPAVVVAVAVAAARANQSVSPWWIAVAAAALYPLSIVASQATLAWWSVGLLVATLALGALVAAGTRSPAPAPAQVGGPFVEPSPAGAVD